MKLRASAASVAFLTLAMGQETAPGLKHVMVAPRNGSRPAALSALNIERGVEYPSVVRLRGSVEIRTPFCLPAGKDGVVACAGEMIVRADEAEFYEDTGRIDARGSVAVTPVLGH
jgi:hypothetical protein